ncbi:unnamed protein product, partial [Mesorhabditis spiculigera]
MTLQRLAQKRKVEVNQPPATQRTLMSIQYHDGPLVRFMKRKVKTDMETAFLTVDEQRSLERDLARLRTSITRVTRYWCSGCDRTVKETLSTACCRRTVRGLWASNLRLQLERLLQLHDTSITKTLEGQEPREIRLLLNYDGYSPTGLTSSSLWPFFLSLLDLPESEQIIIVELRDITTITLDGRLYAVKCRIHNISADDEAKRLSFGMGSCQSSGTCWYCRSDQTRHKFAWYPGRDASQQCIEAEQKRNGFTSHIRSRILDMIDINQLPIDYLHCFSEGILKNWLQICLPGLFGVDKVRRLMGARLDERLAIKGALQTRLPRGCQTIGKVTRLTETSGKYKESFALYVAGPLMLMAPCENTAFAIYGLGICCLAHATYDRCINRRWKEIEVLVDSLGRLANQLEPKLFTYKAHMIFYHLVEHWRKHGTPHRYSTSLFESCNAKLKLGVSASISRGGMALIATSQIGELICQRELLLQLRDAPATKEDLRFLPQPASMFQERAVSWGKVPEPARSMLEDCMAVCIFSSFHIGSKLLVNSTVHPANFYRDDGLMYGDVSGEARPALFLYAFTRPDGSTHLLTDEPPRNSSALA